VPSWPGWLSAIHPFPSLLNALVVFGLSLAARGDLLTASSLALAMLGLQFCIGATNDLADHGTDARVKPGKPLPSGRLSRRAATVIALLAGGGGVALAAAHGPVVAAMAGLMLGAGLAYNFWLSRGPFAWAAYSVALPIVPLYAWWGSVAELPPRPELLLPLAAAAGPALQLANGVVDMERDRRAGSVTPALWLGRRRAIAAMMLLHALVHGTAWLALVSGPGAWSVVPLALLSMAGLLAVAGLRLSASSAEALRERGWQAQASSIGVLALGWLAGAAGW
jgi:4-hydroxybenzoate polyprenyltransferase